MKKIVLFILLVSFAFSQSAPVRIDSTRIITTAAAGRVFICQMTATEYLSAYSNGSVIKLNTFTLDGSYNITSNAEEYQTAGATSNNPFILKLADGKFAITYQNGAATVIKTFSATKSGTWSFTTIDSVSILAADNNYPAIAHLTGNYYVGIQRNIGATQSRVFTFSTDALYDNIAYIDDLIHDTNEGKTPDIAVINSTHFIATYAGSSDDGYVATFSVDASANTITELDEFEFDIDRGLWSNIEQADDNLHYVIGYYGLTGGDMVVEIVEVNGSTYAITPVDSSSVDVSAGNYASMTKLTDILFAFNSRNATSDLITGSFDVDGAYAITRPDTLIHDLNATYSEMARIDDTHAILIYMDNDDFDIVAKTYTYAGASTGWAHTIGGVLVPSKVGGIETFTKVGGVE